MRYILFSGENYYAKGGWHDSPKPFHRLEDAMDEGRDRVKNNDYDHDWWHVVDVTTLEIVAQSDVQAYGN